LYGVELVCELSESLSMATSEGTMYPLLSRLPRNGLIATTWRESRPCYRGHYTLTTAGEAALTQFLSEWGACPTSMDRIIETEHR